MTVWALNDRGSASFKCAALVWVGHDDWLSKSTVGPSGCEPNTRLGLAVGTAMLRIPHKDCAATVIHRCMKVIRGRYLEALSRSQPP
jgi:hypothetical protein